MVVRIDVFFGQATNYLLVKIDVSLFEREVCILLDPRAITSHRYKLHLELYQISFALFGQLARNTSYYIATSTVAHNRDSMIEDLQCSTIAQYPFRGTIPVQDAKRSLIFWP